MERTNKLIRRVAAALVAAAIAAALVVGGPGRAGAAACAGRDAAALDGVFQGQAGRVVGADYLRAYQLPNGTTLVLMQDVFLGPASGGAGPQPVDGRLRPQRRGAARPGRVRGAHAGRRRQLPGWRAHPPAVPLVLGDGRRRRRRRQPARLRGRDGQPPRDGRGRRRRPGGDVAGHDRPGRRSSALVRARPPTPSAALYGWAVAADAEHTYLYAHCYRQFIPGEMLGHDGVVHVGGTRRPRAARPPRGRARVPHGGRVVARPGRRGGRCRSPATAWSTRCRCSTSATASSPCPRRATGGGRRSTSTPRRRPPGRGRRWPR